MVRYYNSKIDSRPRNPGIMPIDPQGMDKAEIEHQMKYVNCAINCFADEDTRREYCQNGICALEYRV